MRRLRLGQAFRLSPQAFDVGLRPKQDSNHFGAPNSSMSIAVKVAFASRRLSAFVPAMLSAPGL